MEQAAGTLVSMDAGASFAIEPENVRIDICGMTAICSCVERTPGGGRLEAINVYKREGGSWKMTLHQAGPVIGISVPDSSG